MRSEQKKKKGTWSKQLAHKGIIVNIYDFVDTKTSIVKIQKSPNRIGCPLVGVESTSATQQYFYVFAGIFLSLKNQKENPFAPPVATLPFLSSPLSLESL